MPEKRAHLTNARWAVAQEILSSPGSLSGRAAIALMRAWASPLFSAVDAKLDSPQLDINVAEIRITEAVWPEDRAPIADLMREYVEALDADISFQDFESEYASLQASMQGRRVSFCSVGRQTKPLGSSPTAPLNAVSAR